MMRTQTVVYEPDNSIKKGYLPLLQDILQEIVENRWLTYQLFKRDFLGAYKQSLFGLFWAIVLPIVSVFTFIILNRAGLFSIGDIKVPYPIYAILGMAFWQLFSTSLIGSSNALVKAGSMISQINFSKKSLVLASAGQSIVSFAIQFLLACLLFLVYGYTPAWGIFIVPLSIIPLLFLGIGMGLILSILNGVMRDIGNIVSMLTTFLMFLTPVLYAKPEAGFLAKATAYNPLYYLISGSRDLALSGGVSEIGGTLLSSLIAAVVFFICLILFHLTETRIAERI